MLAARKLDNGWGLSVRRKELIETCNGRPILFATQPEAKAAADQLNAFQQSISAQVEKIIGDNGGFSGT